jgi:hypothetical protein
MSGSKLGWNPPVCLICQYFMSGSKLFEHTGRFHPKVVYQTLSIDKLNIQDDSIQKL